MLCLRFVIQEVGMPADYVNKLARMFQDIKVSEDLNQAFKELHKNNYDSTAGTGKLPHVAMKFVKMRAFIKYDSSIKVVNARITVILKIMVC